MISKIPDYIIQKFNLQQVTNYLHHGDAFVFNKTDKQTGYLLYKSSGDVYRIAKYIEQSLVDPSFICHINSKPVDSIKQLTKELTALQFQYISTITKIKQYKLQSKLDKLNNDF